MPTITLDDGRVAGAKRAVATFTRHLLFSYLHDKTARWIWSRSDAAVKEPPRNLVTHIYRTFYSPVAANATLNVIADDHASISVNGVLWEPERTWPFAAKIPVELRKGHNLIILHCRNYGRAAMTVAALFAHDKNDTVLLHTDHAWGWIEGPAARAAG
ncbi:hypothetical protein PLESTF_001430300 [Pleodorina starrii]|nr:hypothetical protein PLESTF_001430300 [Pleodorina starrii]